MSRATSGRTAGKVQKVFKQNALEVTVGVGMVEPGIASSAAGIYADRNGNLKPCFLTVTICTLENCEKAGVSYPA